MPRNNKSEPASTREVREWAASQNPPLTVAPRGQIPMTVIAAFMEATGRPMQISRQRSPVATEEPAPIIPKPEPEPEPAWVTVGKRKAQARAGERKLFPEADATWVSA